MKKMFYKEIKILLLLLISFFILQPVAGFCDESQESALITNLQQAKNEKQERRAYFKLLQYYMKEKDYESAITIGNEILKLKLSKRRKYTVYYDLATSYLYLGKPEKALEVGQEAQFLYPKKVETILLLGDIYKNNSFTK